MKVYHIDKGHILSAGQTLDLFLVNSDYPQQLHHIDNLFYSAIQYWSKVSHPQIPRLENLSPFPVKIIGMTNID